MVSRRVAILFAALFLIGILVPATEAVPLVDLKKQAIPGPDPLAPVDEETPAGPAQVYSPYGVLPKPSTSTPSSGFENPTDVRLQGAYGQLVHALAELRDPEPRHVAALLADYFKGVGFGTPGSSIEFEENASISYSHDLGDINGDGLSDILLDSYCVEAGACRPIISVISNPRAFLTAPCYWPHSYLAVSGRDGTNLWNLTGRDHNVALGQFFGCGNEFVVGTVPDGDTYDVLVYEYVVNSAQRGFYVLPIEHRIRLIDGVTGSVVWTKEFTGEFEIAGLFGQAHVRAINLLVNPILQTLARQGVQYLPASNQAGLTLQGVGFNVTASQSPQPLPYASQRNTIINAYFADEWAMGVEPLTGQQLWRKDTFVPNGRVLGNNVPGAKETKAPIADRSVYPLILAFPIPWTHCVYDQTISCLQGSFNTFTGAQQRLYNWYWNHRPCCYDLTGDGVPDIVYVVQQWSPTPSTNTEGLQGMEGSMVAFDGKTGDKLYTIVLKPDIGVRYELFTQHLGDVDGDGASDFFIHQRQVAWDYVHEVTVHSGKTGQQLWNLSTARELQILPLGDADKDGAVDFVYVDYTFDIGRAATWGRSQGTANAMSNVTHNLVKVRSGATGEVLWEYKTFQANSDLFTVFQSFIVNGFPDFNNDGVGDLFTDDPLYLPDLTTVHRFTYLSGADGSELFKIVSAGSFAFPGLVGDVTGDGLDDIYLINGDVNDLWGTLYSGNGTAVWSRRVMESRTSSYASAFPMIRTHLIHNNGTLTDDFFLNFQMRVTQVVRVGNAAFGFPSTRPQLVRYTGWNGSADWAVPAIWDQNLTIVIEGMSPASVRYLNALLYDPQVDRVPPAPLATPIQIVAGTATFGSAFALSFFLGLRRWKP